MARTAANPGGKVRVPQRGRVAEKKERRENPRRTFEGFWIKNFARAPKHDGPEMERNTHAMLAAATLCMTTDGAMDSYQAALNNPDLLYEASHFANMFRWLTNPRDDDATPAKRPSSRRHSRSRRRGGGVQKRKKKKSKVGRKIVVPTPHGGGRCPRDLQNILSDPVMRRDPFLGNLVRTELNQASRYINKHHHHD